MSTQPARSSSTRPGQWAPASSIAFGVGLLTWGMAPIVFERLVSHHPPTLSLLAFNSVTLILGGVFIILGMLIRRAVGWALRAAAYISMAILGAIAVLAASGHASALSLFALLLACNTALTTWTALAQQDSRASPG